MSAFGRRRDVNRVTLNEHSLSIQEHDWVIIIIVLYNVDIMFSSVSMSYHERPVVPIEVLKAPSTFQKASSFWYPDHNDTQTLVTN
jgi:hypothetical protein